MQCSSEDSKAAEAGVFSGVPSPLTVKSMYLQDYKLTCWIGGMGFPLLVTKSRKQNFTNVHTHEDDRNPRRDRRVRVRVWLLLCLCSHITDESGGGEQKDQAATPFKRSSLSSCSSPLSWERQTGDQSTAPDEQLTPQLQKENKEGLQRSVTDLEASSFCCSRILCWASQLAFSSSKTRLFSSSSLYWASRFLFICSWRRSSWRAQTATQKRRTGQKDGRMASTAPIKTTSQ